MEVMLSSESEQIVRRKVESGAYPSVEEVVTVALKLLEELDEGQVADLRNEIIRGVEEAAHGELIDGEEVFREARQRNSEGRPMA